MNTSLTWILIILLGANLAFINPIQTMAEQEAQPAEETKKDEQPQPKQEINNSKPELKPDLPKLGVPRPAPTPVPRRQLKGSVQHREVVKPDRFKGKAAEGYLDGNASKEIKRKPITGRLNQTNETGLGIIGLKFTSSFGRPPVIYQVFPDTPAAEAGLSPRDFIIAVDGIPTLGLTKNEVYNMIVGQPGTQVTISFKHNHDFETRTLTRMDVNAIPDPRVRRDYLSM